MIPEIRNIWDIRSERATPIQAVMSGKWTYEQCLQGTQSLKHALSDSFGDITARYVLEVGSGVGRFTEMLIDANAQVYGVDSSFLMLQKNSIHAKKHAVLINGSADALSLPSQYFDIGFEVTVLIHIMDDAVFTRSLQEMRRVVKPGGLLICCEAVRDDYSLVPTEHTKLRYIHDYETALSMKASEIKKVQCVDELYTIMAWRDMSGEQI